MELLSLKEIQARQLAIIERYGHELPGLRMEASTLTDAQLDELGATLGLRLPESFREVLLQYDFGRLTAGNVWFGPRGDYIEFLESRNGPDISFPNFPWWGEGARPEEPILVAATDGYLVLLNTADGSLAADLRSGDWTNRKVVARTFELLVRGAGTVCFGRKETDDEKGLGDRVAELCGVAVIRVGICPRELAAGVAVVESGSVERVAPGVYKARGSMA